jgi:hypothetical protein
MNRMICSAILMVSLATQSSFITNKVFVQDEANRKDIAKRILDNNIAEKYEDMRADFSAELKAQLPAEKIAGVWKQIIDSEGPFQKVLSTSAVVVEGYNQVLIRCAFKNDNLTMQVTFNQEEKVVGLFWKP